MLISTLESVAKQQEECESCRGHKAIACKRYSIVYDNNNCKIVSEPCQLQSTAKFKSAAESLLKTARIPKRFHSVRAGRDFIVTGGNIEAVRAAEKCILDNGGLYVYGAAGAGKTMLACVIINERALRGKPSLFITAPDMLEELRDFEHTEKREMRLQLLYNTPCLIIDDLGAEKVTEWKAETLFRIINHRYNEELQTIVTSNFELDKVRQRLPDYNGDRIVRRIKAMCGQIHIER